MSCDDYELLEKIGKGSFGKVYKAKHKDGSVVAIKVRAQHFCPLNYTSNNTPTRWPSDVHFSTGAVVFRHAVPSGGCWRCYIIAESQVFQ
jgi:serine/threonine protein kinase